MMITVFDNGERVKLDVEIVAQRPMTRYCGVGGDRFTCVYTAKLARSTDGRLWLNHPRRPSYPEEISLSDAKWFPASAFPKCFHGLEEMIQSAP